MKACCYVIACAVQVCVAYAQPSAVRVTVSTRAGETLGQLVTMSPVRRAPGPSLRVGAEEPPDASVDFTLRNQAITVYSMAGAHLVAGLVVAAFAWRAYDGLQLDLCGNPPRPTGCTNADVDSFRRIAAVADTLLGTALLFAFVATVLAISNAVGPSRALPRLMAGSGMLEMRF